MANKRIITSVAVLGVFGLAIGLNTGSTAEVSAEAGSEMLMMMPMTTYDVTINNVSETQVLAPGFYAVHDDSVSLNFSGQLSPEAFESLSEIGSPTAAAELVEGLPGVKQVIVIDMPILPGESTSFQVMAPAGYMLSGLQMPVGTNDGLALIDSVPLNNESVVVNANNYDNGTEENSELLSGFDGGQPDPSRGAENIENGTPTEPQALFMSHPQLTETVLQASIMPVASDDSLSCSFMALDQNDMSQMVDDSATVPVYTNVGLMVHGDNVVEYTWYADYDGDNIEPVEQTEVMGDHWSYTMWTDGEFDFSAMIMDSEGNTATCDIHIHASHDVVSIEN